MNYNDFTEETMLFFERSYSIGGTSYLVLFGHHVNGGYVVILNHNIATEIGVYRDSRAYNTEQLISAGLPSDAAMTIAAEIERYIVENEHIVQAAVNKSNAAMMNRLRSAGLAPVKGA